MILMVCPDPLDGTSWYRGLGPFTELAKQLGQELYVAAQPSWYDLLRSSVVFLQRPVDLDTMRLACNAHSLGKKVWVDYDDDVTHVPKTNLCEPGYNEVGVQRLVEGFVECADVVTVSTPALKAIWPKAHVIPNAIPDILWGKWKTHQNPIIAWRGGATHIADLDLIRAPIQQLLTDLPVHRFAFIGNEPWWANALEPQKRVLKVKWKDVLSFQIDLINLAPEVLWVPLEDTIFNRAKSNITWLEATAAGTVCVASDLPEFHQPGIINVQNGNWVDCTFDALQHVTNYLDQSRDFISENLLLSKVNRLRKDILDDLLK